MSFYNTFYQIFIFISISLYHSEVFAGIFEFLLFGFQRLCIEISLFQVNDNAPEFTSENYTVAIAEDTPTGTSFSQISAIDLDEGDNAIIDYYLIEESGNGDTFKLDRSSGTLRVVAKLDREMTARLTCLQNPSSKFIYRFTSSKKRTIPTLYKLKSTFSTHILFEDVPLNCH